MVATQAPQLRAAQASRVSQINLMNQIAIINSQQRFFAKKRKSKKGSSSDDGATTDADAEDGVEEDPRLAAVTQAAEPTPEPVAPAFEKPTAAPVFEEVSRDMFAAFTVGDVKRIDSVPDNKPPTSEDTIEGRYAAVLFMTASQEESLFTIYEDVTYIRALYDNSETFRMFT